MSHQRDARLLNGIIAATFRRRDKDDIGVGSQHQLRIEVAFHTDLHDTTVFYARQDILVEEVLRTCDTLHHIVGIENGEVRQLQSRHTDGILDRHSNFCIVIGHTHVIALHQSKAIAFTNIH